MQCKIILLVIFFSTFSSAQINEYEELLNFSFGSSKEEVRNIWKETSYAKFGDLVLTSDDTLQIRIDDFKYFDGWQFLFIKDSLYKIQMFSKIIESKCHDVIEWFKAKYGEPKITGGDIYYWWYRNSTDSTTNKISLSCSCFFCEPIPDSARLVIGIKNDKLYKRVGDLTVNKEFLKGVENFKWETTSDKIKKQIRESAEMQLIPEQNTNLLYEKSLYAKYGKFANVPVFEWCFTFFYDKLYKVDIKFDSDLSNNDVRFVNILYAVNDIYGPYFSYSSIHENRYYWYFNNYDETHSSLGKIILDKNEFKGENQKITLTFEYVKKSSMKE